MNGCQVLNSDLGLTVAASANIAASQTSTTIVDDCPRSILVLASIVSGTLTMSLDRAASGAPAQTSPVSSVTLIGAASAGFIKMDTTTGNLNWNLKLVGTTCNVDRFVVLDLAKLAAGEDSISIGAGQLAYESLVTGDGSGAFPISV